MIQDKILDNQVGIQYPGEKDLSETPTNRLLNTGVLLGKFKRGIVGKPFVVTANNYKKILGYNPNNPDYKVVEDFFMGSGQRLVVMRLGKPNQQLTVVPAGTQIGTGSPTPASTTGGSAPISSGWSPINDDDEIQPPSSLPPTIQIEDDGVVRV